MLFPEEFLHYIWRFRLFDHRNLFSETGESLVIVHPGHHNKDAGPDFSTSKIRIDKTEWIGNVEIHVSSSDWLRHNHQADEAYNNVILHVVYLHDVEIHRPDGSLLPVLILNGRIRPGLFEKYENLISAPYSFPCENQIHRVDNMIVINQLSRALIERMDSRSLIIFDRLALLKGNWDETFYQFLAKNFGFKVNALPFELLAESLSSQILSKHLDRPLQIAALIFGQAGFLDQPLKESYPKLLKKEYQFLRKKYGLNPINLAGWKFMRMRPANFPTVRLAEFAALISESRHLFSRIIEIKEIPGLLKLFSGIKPDDYWNTHYHFNNETRQGNCRMGRTSIENILVNSVALFLFAYGRHTDKSYLINRAIALLENLPSEKNSITRPYELAGLEIRTAFQSQGILELSKQYCREKRCLHCAVGINLLKPTN